MCSKLTEYQGLHYLISVMNPSDEELIDLGHSPKLFNKVRDDIEKEKRRKINISNPNINEDSKKVLKDLFGLTSAECDNLDPECSFVSPMFLREIRDRENKK